MNKRLTAEEIVISQLEKLAESCRAMTFENKEAVNLVDALAEIIHANTRVTL